MPTQSFLDVLSLKISQLIFLCAVFSGLLLACITLITYYIASARKL